MTEPSRLQRIRARLIRQGGIMAAGVAALALLAGGISWYVSDLETEKKRLQGQVNQYRQKSAMLQAKMVKARESLDLYNAINTKTEGAGFVIEREQGKQLLDDLKREFYLASLAVTMSPVATLEDGSLAPGAAPSAVSPEAGAARKASVIFSEVKLAVTALTDEEILSFANAVKLRFPGYVRMTRFNIERTERLTPLTLAAISRGEMPNLAKGDIQFRWIGFRYNDTGPDDKKPAGGASKATAVKPPFPGGAR